MQETSFGYIPTHWRISDIISETSIVTDYVANGSFASLAENVQYKTDKDYAILIRLVDYNNHFAGDFIYIDEHAYNFLSKSQLFGDEIIISNVGANVGTVFKCPRLKNKMALAPNSIMVKFNGCNDFYYYWLSSPAGQGMLQSIVTGSAQPKFNKTNFRTMSIPVPPLGEQKMIAAILSSLDEKIETNRKINARLEELAQAIFKSWFIDFEPFGGKMPDDWEDVVLSDIGDIIGGATPSKDNPSYYTNAGNGIAWLTPKDLSETRAKFTDRGNEDITTLGYQKCSARIMPAGSILFSSRAPIGYISIALNEICTNQGFKSFVPKKVGTAFAYYLLKILTPEIENKSTGSTFKEASGALMKSLRTILPDKNTLCKFEKVCNPIFNLQRDCEKESARLAALRDTLLPKLMSGELIPE